MKKLTREQIRELLNQKGIPLPAGLKPPRPGQRFKAAPDITPPTHTIWAKRLGAIWWGSLSIPQDCEKLSSLALDTGESFYVFSGPVPSTRPFPRVADRLVWWTRAILADGDHFINADDYKPGRFALPTRNYRYPTGTLLDLLSSRRKGLVALLLPARFQSQKTWDAARQKLESLSLVKERDLERA